MIVSFGGLNPHLWQPPAACLQPRRSFCSEVEKIHEIFPDLKMKTHMDRVASPQRCTILVFALLMHMLHSQDTLHIIPQGQQVSCLK